MEVGKIEVTRDKIIRVRDESLMEEIGEGECLAFKHVSVGLDMAMLCILDEGETQILENFKIRKIEFGAVEGGVLHGYEDKGKNWVSDEVAARIFRILGIEENPVSSLFKNYEAFKKLCEYLDAQGLQKLLTSSNYLYKNYWENNNFWFGLYCTNFYFTGFKAGDLNWRPVYLKKLKES